MIIGVGIDVCIINRIENTINKFGIKFKKRCFTENEIVKCDRRYNSAPCYAKRFAAKEAFSKAIGTGIRNGINWKLIEVINNKKGQPFIKLHGKAKETLDGLIPKNMIPKVFISLTDEKELAQAIVIIEAIRKDTI